MAGLILYIGGFILPNGNAAAQRVIANALLLKEMGYEVIFMGTPEKNRPEGKSVITTKQSIKGFYTFTKNYPISITSWIRFVYSIRDVKQLVEYIGKNRVKAIIAYNYPSVALKRLSIYCMTANIKLISDCTEWSSAPLSNPFRFIIKELDTLYRMRVVNKQIDGIIAISTYLFNYYLSAVQNLIELPPLVDTADEKWNIGIYKPANVCRLIYAGSPGQGSKDRIDHVINTLSAVKYKVRRKFSLTVIGITKSQYSDIFGIKSIPVNLKDDLFFIGRISHTEVIKAIQRSEFSIFLRDSTRLTKAGFPTKFVESISCGTPVLTNNSSNIRDYLKDSQFGFLLDTKTYETLVDSLAEIINLPTTEIQNMKQACFESGIFYYRNFKSEFKEFIDKVITA